jgi:hypothetical protein
MVTTLPKYADGGANECNAGRSNIFSTLFELKAVSDEGLLNVSLKEQFPAVVTFALTATMRVGLSTVHAGPIIPHTLTEQFCAPATKLLPRIVMVLPA